MPASRSYQCISVLLRDLRAQAQLTQEELALLAGTSQPTVAN